MKFKHNKKRNTIFLFEVLVKELTKSVIAEDLGQKEKITSLIRKHFKRGSALFEEYRLYKTILESQTMSANTAERLITEVKKRFEQLDKEEIFKQQSALINEVNKTFSKDIFLNFIPNYKNYATMHQIFNKKNDPRKQVVLEERLLEYMTKNSEESQLKQQISGDRLVFKSFMEKFNTTYSENLNESQKKLLNKYIASFADNGLEFKIYFNSELGRLKEVIETSLEKETIKESEALTEKMTMLVERITNYRTRPIDVEMINEVYKLQSLTSELI